MYTAKKSDGEEVGVELDDEGYPPRTGALNFHRFNGGEQEIIEVFHLPQESLIQMSQMLDTSKGAAQGLVVISPVVNGRVTDEMESIQIMRSSEGAVLSRDAGNKYIFGVTTTRLLRNECDQLADEGCIIN